MVVVLDRAAPVAASWVERASCRGKPMSLWFPERFDSVSGRIGKAICATCPVRVCCLEQALIEEADGYRNGIRGGLSPSERGRLAPAV